MRFAHVASKREPFDQQVGPGHTRQTRIGQMGRNEPGPDFEPGTQRASERRFMRVPRIVTE